MTAALQHKNLYMSVELSNKKWKLGFSNGVKIRKVNVAARHQEGVMKAVGRAKEKLGLPPDAEVYSCYEAGRDGFWIHRFLEKNGIKNLVVDPGSIEVPKRMRRVKTDSLDAEKLVRMLIRHLDGERKVWGISRVPEEEREDDLRLHRELERLKKERTAHRARIRSLLTLHGISSFPGKRYQEYLERIRTWENKPLPSCLKSELGREYERLEKVEEQIKLLQDYQVKALKEPQTESERKAQKLYRLKGVGPRGAWILAMEFFGWRKFRNRREVGGLSGLTGTPYNSGSMVRDQGMSKAGNRRVRYIAVELAWCWLRNQPESELSRWFWERYGYGNSRMRRIGIVALARKLLVAMWKFLEYDEVPEGAIVAEA